MLVTKQDIRDMKRMRKEGRTFSDIAEAMNLKGVHAKSGKRLRGNVIAIMIKTLPLKKAKSASGKPQGLDSAPMINEEFLGNVAGFPVEPTPETQTPYLDAIMKYSDVIADILSNSNIPNGTKEGVLSCLFNQVAK